MKVAITGASGLVGGNLATQLCEKGVTVRATRRGSTVVKHLEKLPIEWVSAELSDTESLKRAFDGCDAVFHCAAQGSVVMKITPQIRAANVDGTANVISAVRAASVKRLIHCSTVGAVGLSVDGKPCDENAKWNFPDYGLGDAYVTTKHLAEELVHAEIAKGLDAVIVNPTYMFGPLDSKPSSGEMIVEIAKRRVPGWTPGMNNFVDVRDVTRGMQLAWEKGVKGERYILGGQNMSFKEIFELIAKVVGVKAPSMRAPYALSRVIGWWGDLTAALTGAEPMLNSTKVLYGYTPRFIFSSEKSKQQLGYTNAPLEQAIKDAFDWFKANGKL
jgi:dihydroflavonol-4-reductase